MSDFEQRMERIRQAAVEQNKSVNIDVRAYRGEWVAGVGGVQTLKSNSFQEIIASIEEALNLK